MVVYRRDGKIGLFCTITKVSLGRLEKLCCLRCGVVWVKVVAILYEN